MVPIRRGTVLSNRILWASYRSISGLADETSVPSGLFVAYKPKGWTSQDVCGKIKSILNPPKEISRSNSPSVFSPSPKRLKIGHGGTLDPMAEGILVIGVKNGCKLLQSYLQGKKEYCAIGLLGYETDTLDAEGKVTRTAQSDHITQLDLSLALEKFRGDILQVPPMYSALKFSGKRLYELARKGISVNREARKVTVHSLELVEPFDRLPEFSLSVSCGGGFYVRCLIEDLAKECGGAGHMISLVRTGQGPFTIKDALPIEKWDIFNISNAIREHTFIASTHRSSENISV